MRVAEFDFENEADRSIRELQKKGNVLTGPNSRKVVSIGNKGKGILAESDRPGVPGAKELVYYPSVEHARFFARAISGSTRGGPGYYFPGCVGSLFYHVDPKEGTHSIGWMQGSYSQRKTPYLPRGMATRYGGWRNHLLGEVFLRALRAGGNKVELYPGLAKVYTGLTPHTIKIFEEIAKKHGYRVSPEGAGNSYHLVASKD